MLEQTYADTSSTSNYTQEFIQHLRATENHAETQENHPEETKALYSGFNLRELKDAINSAKRNKTPAGENRIPYDLLKNFIKMP